MRSYKLFTDETSDFYARYENLFAQAMREMKEAKLHHQYKKTLKSALFFLQIDINAGNQKALDFRTEMFNYFVDKALHYSDKSDNSAKELQYMECYFSYKNLEELPTNCVISFIRRKNFKEKSPLSTIPEENEEDTLSRFIRRMR